MRDFKVAVAITCGCAALTIGLGVYLWLHHTWLLSAHYNLRLATPPLGEEGHKLSGAFVRDVTSNYRFIRIVPVQASDVAESARALADGRADLAIVRSDSDAAIDGRTIFIFRKVALAILLPPSSAIEKAQDLRGKMIGILSPTKADDLLISRFAEFYGLKEAEFRTVSANEALDGLKHNQIAAVAVLGPIGEGRIADTFALLRKRFKSPPTFLEIGETEAIVARFPAYEALEIPQGTFGGNPAEPPAAVNTIGLTARLVSRPSLPDRFAGEITRLLLVAKRQLITTVPAAVEMEAPDVDQAAVLPVHPGTLAYLNGEQVSL